MFLLDTNVISEARKMSGGRADPNVKRWLEQQPAATFYLSVITVLELELGILLLQRRDAVQAAMLRRWLDYQVVPTFANRTFPIDLAIARRCAQLHVPDPRSERDALIAATAIVHNLTIVTRNVADFAPTGCSVLNPWEQH
jgi:hypothetical protein